MLLNADEFAQHIEQIRMKLYKTALLYLGNEYAAIDVLDEAVYKALRNYQKLRQPEFFDTWMTRILINECYNERKRRKRYQPLDELPETAVEEFDSLPLREAIRRLPKELKEVVILRYFSGYTLKETAETLQIPQGTAATRQRRALALLRIELREEDFA
jgi:RNA polymerase sigma-70 factor (ECF subfamily)